MTDHDQYMRRAIALARRATGLTSPNPLVGAVIVRDGRIIAEGWHRGPGLPHAEIDALDNATEPVDGAAMYVTLEPCSHQGRTPPCAPAVAASGIATLVAGMTDPNPLVAGRGLRILRERGVTVIENILESECRALNAPFVKTITTGLPLVTIKAAMSLDGKTATRTLDSRWISSPESRALVHRIRGEVDAILTGSRTVIADDPQFTSRTDPKIKDPLRVVLDSRLSMPAVCNFTSLADDGKSAIITTPAAPSERIAQFRAAGCSVLTVPASDDGRVDLREALKAIAALGVCSIMVESGGELAYSLISAGLADRFMFFVAPIIIGGREARTPAGGAGAALVADAFRASSVETRAIGPDILITGSFTS